MHDVFDRRVLPGEVLSLVRACQQVVPAHLAGGAALSGAHLGHRLSKDIDLFCHRAEDVRDLVRGIGQVGSACGAEIAVVRDAGTHVRARVRLSVGELEMDIVHEGVPDIRPPDSLEGILVESFEDLRASKLTCILSRSEPRDLVDLLYLDRAGFPPEKDMSLALKKDGGIDPGVLAWLLGQFPIRPLPKMLGPLTDAELLVFREDLRERLRRLAVPE